MVDSDFTFLNERLARHYGIPGVSGVAMRKVQLPKDSVRGGLMTQASVLKVTANGTTTSPVIRGVWIMERILGFHTAPPAGVPAIEPDIRGAVTIRQQLDRHRADPTCASCHRKIDPPGFALESFDVMGGWRDRYRAFREDATPAPGIGLSGQRFAFHYGPQVDAAGALDNGRKFSDIRDFKQLILNHRGTNCRPKPRAASSRPTRRARRLASPTASRWTRSWRKRAGRATGFATSSTPSSAASCSNTSDRRLRMPEMNRQSRRAFRAISRRAMLRGAGVGLALPFLNAMVPSVARAQSAATPRRLFAICNNLGLLPGDFFPAEAGPNYTPSAYLKVLQDHRADFTVFSGVSHPNVDGGHPADISFLTAAPHPASSSFRNTISLDQYVAERIGNQTRFPSLTLAVNTGSRSLSWTGNGVAIPPEQSAASVFRQMFIQGSPGEVEAKIAELDTGRSILDTVIGQARDLERSVGASDRARLDQYFTSVRELENRLQASKGWERKPKPVVKAAEPQDPPEPGAVHGQGREYVQPGSAGFRDRLHPLGDSDAGQRQHSRGGDQRRHHQRRLP